MNQNDALQLALTPDSSPLCMKHAVLTISKASINIWKLQQFNYLEKLEIKKKSINQNYMCQITDNLHVLFFTASANTLFLCRQITNSLLTETIHRYKSSKENLAM